jgi:hypothetical protein
MDDVGQTEQVWCCLEVAWPVALMLLSMSKIRNDVTWCLLSIDLDVSAGY